jgi:hypothetical protein
MEIHLNLIAMDNEKISNGNEKALFKFLNTNRDEAVVKEYHRLNELEAMRMRKIFPYEDIAIAMMIAEYGSMEESQERLRTVTEQLMSSAVKALEK